MPRLTLMGAAKAVLWVFVLTMLATQLVKLWWSLGGPRDAVLHLGLALGVMLAVWPLERAGKMRAVVAYLLLPLAVTATLFMISVWPDFQMRAFFPTSWELGLGVSLSVIVLIVTWSRFGPLFPLLALFGLGWALFGDEFLPPFLAPADVESSGILGTTILSQASGVINVFAQYVWLILFFGALVELSGAGKIMWWAARAIGKRTPAGPAMGAVVASAVAGSFIGSGGSNVAVTGPVTIPAMKGAGYTPEESAAIEAVASDASGITPPILGSVAFIMADLVGVSYARILGAVLLPALLWYLGVGVYLSALARAKGQDLAEQIDALPEVSPREALRSLFLLGLPLGSLIYLILDGYSLRLASLVALAVLVGLVPFLGAKRTVWEWLKGIEEGCVRASSITVVVGCVMIFLGALEATALDSRIADMILRMTGENLLLVILATWVAGILLGAGLPPLAIYFILIISVVPVLNKMGLEPLQGHFVAYLMGLTGFIIPPIATGVLIAANIANSHYLKSCWQAMRTDTVILLLPLYILVVPELLLIYDSLSTLILSVLCVTVGILSMALASAGWAGSRLNWTVRASLIAVPALQVIGFGVHLPLLVYGAVALAGVAVLYGFTRGRHAELAGQAGPAAGGGSVC